MAKKTTKNQPYYRGNLVQDGKNGKKCNHKGCPPRECEHEGWIVGAFMKPGPRETELLEIKYWEHDRKFKHQVKTSCTLEFTLVLHGELEAMVNGDTVALSAGGEHNYVVIPPGIRNAIPERVVSQCVVGLTIKAPSIRCAKHEGKGRSFKVEPASGPNLGA